MTLSLFQADNRHCEACVDRLAQTSQSPGAARKLRHSDAIPRERIVSALPSHNSMPKLSIAPIRSHRRVRSAGEDASGSL